MNWECKNFTNLRIEDGKLYVEWDENKTHDCCCVVFPIKNIAKIGFDFKPDLMSLDKEAIDSHD